MRIQRKWSIIPLACVSSGIFLSLLFTNCQSQLQNFSQSFAQQNSLDQSSTGDNPSVRAQNNQSNESPFAAGKVQINLSLDATAQARKMQQKSNAPRAEIPAGTKLIAIASNECMFEKGAALSAKIYDYDQEFENLDEQAYVWTTDQDHSLAEIQRLADEDPCVKGLANDGVAYAVSAPNDPFLGNENQFLSIGGSDTYGFFNDPRHGSIKPVVVAMIDSGSTPTHPDLQNQFWHGPANEIGHTYLNGLENSTPIDDFGHGTNLSGIIAAQSGNAVGIAGVMGHNIQLMAIKVQNNTGQGLIADMVNGINYARANHADVINISMVGYGANAALQTALQTAASENIFIAVAAGNDALAISTGSAVTYAVPAAYGAGIAGMLTVGSTVAYSNVRSAFSNYGPTYVEIAAPGSGSLYFTTITGYGTGSGTSYSSPQVAAAAALTISFLRQHGISYTAANIESILTTTAYNSSSATSYFAQGRVLDLRGLKEYLQSTYIGAQSGGFDDF